jgi:hypothetical protein
MGTKIGADTASAGTPTAEATRFECKAPDATTFPASDGSAKKKSNDQMKGPAFLLRITEHAS